MKGKKMALVRSVKPVGSARKAASIAAIGVIVMLALSFALSRNGVPFLRMAAFIGICFAPAMAFIMLRIRKNGLSIFDDHFRSVQGMSSVTVNYSEVMSVSMTIRPLSSGFGPSVVSAPMMLFTTREGEREFLYSEYRPGDLSVLFAALIARNPDSRVSEDIRALLGRE